VDERRWEASLREALRADDRVSLAALFDDAVGAWGRPDASRRWWLVVSGYDGQAVTG
jgi:hypothetical protein